MATDNCIPPDMMAANYWPHTTQLEPLRQLQGDYAVAPPHHTALMPPSPGGIKGSPGIGSSVPPVIRRLSLATTSMSSASTTGSFSSTTVGGVRGHPSRLYQEEED